MSRLYKIQNKYRKYSSISDKFVLNVLSKKFLRNGKKLQINSLIKQAFNFIKAKEEINSYLVFLIALYNISPRLGIIFEVNPINKQIIYKKRLLTKFESLKQGLNLLSINYAKNKGRNFSLKLANEILLSFYKKSFSYKKKMEIEREIVKKTAGSFTSRKKIKLFQI